MGLSRHGNLGKTELLEYTHQSFIIYKEIEKNLKIHMEASSTI